VDLPRRSGLDRVPGVDDRGEFAFPAGELGDQAGTLLASRVGRHLPGLGNQEAARGLEWRLPLDRPSFQSVGLDRCGDEIASEDGSFDHQPMTRFLVWGEVAHPATESLGVPEAGLVELTADDQLGRTEKCSLGSVPLGIGPMLERRAAWNPVRWKEGPLVEIEGTRELSPVDRGKEPIAIDLERQAKLELLITPNGFFAQLAANLEQGLAKRSAAALGIEVGPEEIEEKLTRGPAARNERQVKHQGESLARPKEGRSACGRKPGPSQGPEKERVRLPRPYSIQVSSSTSRFLL